MMGSMTGNSRMSPAGFGASDATGAGRVIFFAARGLAVAACPRLGGVLAALAGLAILVLGRDFFNSFKAFFSTFFNRSPAFCSASCASAALAPAFLASFFV